MDRNLDKTLQITKETEFKSLYSWSIQEVDAEGNVGKDKYIPFRWSLFFDALNISYLAQLKREDADVEDDIDDIRYLNIDDGKIHADLSLNARGESFAPDIRFFGSDRNINNFSLTIFPVSSHKKEEEACYLWGFPETEHEWDFQREVSPDAIYVEMYVNLERFIELKELVIAKSLSGLNISISRAEGLYSEWSPSIRPTDIKVLTTDNKDIQIKDDELKNLETSPVGKVPEWTLNVNTNQEFVFPKIVDEDVPDLFDDEAEELDTLTKEEYFQKVTNAELNKITTTLAQAKTFAYIVIGLLVVIALSLI